MTPTTESGLFFVRIENIAICIGEFLIFSWNGNRNSRFSSNSYFSTAVNRKMKSQRKSYCMTVLNNGTCNHCWANCSKKNFVMIYNDLILQVWTTITSYFLNIWYYFVPSGILHVRSSQTSWKTSHLILKSKNNLVMEFSKLFSAKLWSKFFCMLHW